MARSEGCGQTNGSSKYPLERYKKALKVPYHDYCKLLGYWDPKRNQAGGGLHLVTRPPMLPMGSLPARCADAMLIIGRHVGDSLYQTRPLEWRPSVVYSRLILRSPTSPVYATWHTYCILRITRFST